MEKQIKLIFIGNRLNGDALVAAFIKSNDKKETVYFFNKGKYIIGCLYRAVESDEKIALYAKNESEWPNKDHTNKEEWQKLHYAAKERYQDILKEKRISTPLSNSVKKELIEITKNLKIDDAEAYLKFLMNEIIWKPKREAHLNKIRKAK